jgi:lipoate-protein ligase B
MNVKILDLGRREYKEVWELQKQLADSRARGEIADSLILVEHEHVITLGRKTSGENLKPQNIPVYQVERGGDATYHGPGQLVGYPIINLRDHDVRRFVRMLEEVLLQTVLEFGIRAERKEGHHGLWVNGKKLASIGVAVTNWVTYHGFALNVNTDLSYFTLIKPCGLDPELLTSMKRILGEDLEMANVKERLAYHFETVFEEPAPSSPIAGVPTQYTGKD